MASVAPAPASPSTSPRLPSPPPFPEVQISPQSPTPGVSSDSLNQDVGDGNQEDSGVTRRIRPGTKAADMAMGPPLVPLADLQEHLMALFLHATRAADSEATTIPITRSSATKLATPPDGVDRALWLYELCRLLVQRANSLIVGFFADSPPCSAAACPEMRASEWQYLCAVHDPPKSCCAIDYCCHTLDWAANILTSQKHFPSRLSLGSDAPGSSQASVRQLTNIFRRVYRMFAHAWFQHREVFWQMENQEGLYIFYKTVCDVYNLIPEENYTVPPEAEGGGPTEEPATAAAPAPPAPAASTKSTEQDTKPEMPKFERQTSLVDKAVPELLQPPGAASMSEGGGQGTASPEKTTLSTGATTRRHKQTPSTGSFVTTIQESDEDSDEKKEALAASGATTFISTVRRDPSSSPPKPTLLPLLPKLPDFTTRQPEEQQEQQHQHQQLQPQVKLPGEDEDEAARAAEVTEGLSEMKIEDPTAASQPSTGPDDTPGGPAEPAAESKHEAEESVSQSKDEGVEPTASES